MISGRFIYLLPVQIPTAQWPLEFMSIALGRNGLFRSWRAHRNQAFHRQHLLVLQLCIIVPWCASDGTRRVPRIWTALFHPQNSSEGVKPCCEGVEVAIAG